MIDIKQVRTSFDTVKAALAKKDSTYSVERLAAVDLEARNCRAKVEQLRSEKNNLASRAKGGVTDDLRNESIAVGVQLKEAEKQLAVLEEEFSSLLLHCPNIPLDDVPTGGKEANVVIKEWGEKPSFSFSPRHHMDLSFVQRNVEFSTGAMITGSQFPLYRGQAVDLLYALEQLMLKNNREHGFELVIPPTLVNETSLIVSGNLPKFQDDLYRVADEPSSLYLLPTSEVALTNMYRGQIIADAALPIRMTSLTSCFRKEAGGYGAEERGLIRLHEFRKVELFSITRPEESDNELQKMVSCAEAILQALGLHYRITLLAAGDASFQSAKTYDIEVWMPGQKQYKEVSSCSNCTDFQARRGKIRFSSQSEKGTQYVHTLNASSLALPRVMVALLETYQKEDGSVVLPAGLL